MACSNRQECFIVSIVCLILLIFFQIKIGFCFFIRVFKQLFGILTPGTKMVFIEYYQVPIVGMYKLVFCFYATTVICSKQVLERTEHNNRAWLVRLHILFIDIDIVIVCILIGDKLPSLKVNMVHKVFRPGGFHRRLKS